MINRCLIHVYFKPIIPFNECNGKKYVYKRVLYVSLKLFLRCVDYLLCKK